MQSIKEKKLLIKFAQSMGQPVDPAIVEADTAGADVGAILGWNEIL